MAIWWRQGLGREWINPSLRVCEGCVSFCKERGSFDVGKEGSMWCSFPVNSWQGANHSKLSSFLLFPITSTDALGGGFNIKEAEPHYWGAGGGGAAHGVKWTAECGLETCTPLPTLQNQCEPEKSDCSLDHRFLNSNNNFWDRFGYLLIKRQICGVNVLFNSVFPLRFSSINTSS